MSSAAQGTHGSGHADHPEHLAHHFHTLDQQHSSGKLGMWIFLATEVLFFGGLFMMYAVVRYFYPKTMLAAHEELSAIMGGINTVVLLTSSLTMALAVRACQLGQKELLKWMLIATIAFAFVFLVVKYFEYSAKFEHCLLPGRAYCGGMILAQDASHWICPTYKPDHACYHAAHLPGLPHVFFAVYFVMTGLHGVHVVAGIIALGWILWKAYAGTVGPSYYTPVENVGLYWHLVDLIWIFLFPLLYLVK